MATYHDIAAGDLAPTRSAVGDQTTGGVAGVNKLWLPLWSGEVINAYDQFNMFENLITTKTLTGGVSYEFPITGTVGLNPSWGAGVELGGDTADNKTTTIKVVLDNRPMAAHFETDNVDMLITQWDYRSELARQAGLTLANTRDRQILMALVAAGAVPAIGAADPRGLDAAAFHVPSQIKNAASPAALPSAATDAEGLAVLQAIEDYLVVCQENDVAIGSVYCAVPPKVFQVIRALGIPRSTGGNVNTDAFLQYPTFAGSSDMGGLGAPLTQGMNMMTDSLDYMGVKIVKTNHIPKVLQTGTAAIGGTKYQLNCSGFGIYGIIFQSEAIAGLSLMGMKVDTVQDVRRNTQFTVGSMLKGTGILKPEMVKLITAGATAAAVNERSEIAALLATSTGTNWSAGFAAEYATTSA